MSNFLRRGFLQVNNLYKRAISQPINNPFGAERFLSSDKPVTEAEIRETLKGKYPDSDIQVVDVSGGCGAMFNITIEAKEFKGLNVAKQHRAVYAALSEQIKKIHGLHLETRAPKT